MGTHAPDLLDQLVLLDSELRQRSPHPGRRARSLRAQRTSVRNQIDPKVLVEYDRLAQAGAVPPLASVDEGVCTGCRIRLPRQFIQDARATPGLVRCPSCGRVILLQRDLAPLGGTSADPRGRARPR